MISAWLLGLAFAAEPVRYGVFVGNDEGHPGEDRLVFAAADALKMHSLFTQWGEVDRGRATLLQNQTKRVFWASMEGIQRQMSADAAAGHPTELVFYYSGHGDDLGLHLGAATVTHDELRQWLDGSGADVRIAFIDACQSGALVRNKGGTRGPAMEFALDVERARGTAVLTSSAASELSQESDEVGGGFFTHYLHSALRGAGDRDRDGEVTLTEAYSFVHGETVFGTRGSGAQTPRYDFDLVGAGELVLTSLEEANAGLNFLGDLDGNYAVWDESRKRYVAEVRGDQLSRVAVKPGIYFIHQRHAGWVDEAKIEVRRQETRTVAAEDFQQVPLEQTASRGDLTRQVRKATLPKIALRAVVGGRGFGDQRGDNHVPSHIVGGLQVRALPRTGRTYFGGDLTTGAGAGVLSISGLDVPTNVQSYSLGANAGFATGPRLFRLGVGGRVSFNSFSRTFPDTTVSRQTAVGLSPGTNSWVGVHLGRFSMDLELNLQLFTATFDDINFPGFGELWVAAGYRF